MAEDDMGAHDDYQRETNDEDEFEAARIKAEAENRQHVASNGQAHPSASSDDGQPGPSGVAASATSVDEPGMAASLLTRPMWTGIQPLIQMLARCWAGEGVHAIGKVPLACMLQAEGMLLLLWLHCC